MIKKYMCSNFLASEILSDVTSSSHLTHRMGVADGIINSVVNFFFLSN